MSSFPDVRLRRLRGSPILRDMVRETRLSVRDLVYPMFVTHGRNVHAEIDPMPGIYHLSLDRLIPEIGDVVALGIPAVLLFGIPVRKDPVGTEAYELNGIVQEAVRVIKQTAPELLVITDTCLCEYTDHGHCGVIADGEVLNDATTELLAKESVSHARAGADIIAPSDMMDGRIGVIRDALDDAGFDQTPIMAYSAKYSSAFYGPFRDAADSAPQFGDRRSYQMDPPNVTEALREVELDLQEGADIVMVKPALPYLDIIRAVKDRYDAPLAAYNVSGEYAMLKAAARLGWLDEERVMVESVTAIRRAGADMILTYFAKALAALL